MKCPSCNSEVPARSINRNNHFHACMQVLANYCGYSIEEMKVLVKDVFGWYEEFPNKETGEVLKVYESTTKWSNAMFDERFIQIKIWAAEQFGINLLTRQEYIEALQEKEN